MTAFKFATAVLVVLVALPLVGQDKGAPPTTTDLPPAVSESQLLAERRAAAVTKAAEMTEDVEVLRLLLNKSFGFPRKQTAAVHTGGTPMPYSAVFDATTGNPTAGSNLALTYHWATQHAAGPSAESFDGVYLKGHGVAYTIRVSGHSRDALPPHEKTLALGVTCQKCHTWDAVAKFDLAAAATLAKPQTDWEKARDELRGVPPKADADGGKPNLAVMCAPGNLTETVTKVLAANGRHLRHLTADEAVSVVVTYDGVSGPAHDRATGTMADPNLWTPSAPTGTRLGFTPDEAKQIVLGDLHLKQGKHADAVKAYQTALARYPDMVTTVAAVKGDFPKGMKEDDVAAAVKELRTGVTSAYKSLAQAHIGAGNLDEAKRALDLAKNIQIRVTGTDAKPSGSAGPPVPAKIILTAKKAHLDAAEKLSAADFRKGVTVETVGMTGVKK
jgi:tetratricopeptide (TPR) repeat protein